MIRALINRRYLKYRDMVWCEVTPPASISKTPEATEQLFSVIHGMYSARSLKEKLLQRSPVMSFEITSTKKEGIRYLIQVERSRSDLLQKAITAYIPAAKIKEVEERFAASDEMLELKERGHYVLPLVLSSAVDQYDPLSYVTSAMTKLSDGERVTMQLVVSPIKLRETRTLARKIMSHEEILSRLSAGNFIWLQRISDGINNVLWGAVDLTSEVYHGTTAGAYTTDAGGQKKSYDMQVAKGQRPARTLSSFERELMESMHHKVTQPLFQVNLRILASGPHAQDHIQTIRGALDGYSVPLYQSLRAKMRFPVIHGYRHKLADKRLAALSPRSSLILSASEIASLYHFPSSRISKTDNLITSLSKTLPAPVSLKSGRELAVIIGENHHHGTVTPIGLTEAERERHVFIMGGTGNGKTTMLQYAIVQDIRAGRGVAIVDPHGDLAESLLRYIPEERIKDVIYINPDDLSYPIGINLLEIADGITGDELLREKDVITESVISVLRKIFSDDEANGHRIEYVLRNTVQTALTLEKPTLFTVFKLLNDAKFRRDVVKNLKDENLISFWKNEIGKAGDMQRVKMTSGITAKIGRFLFSASAKRMLEQEKSTIDFDRILSEGKILICNVSKGLLGEDTSALFGITVLAKLQLASLRRARMNAAERKPFYLYVDEFQNFATTSFTQMLSEARKYKLLLTMAEQSTSQQDEQRLVDVILANIGTVICFRSGSPTDERLILPLFSPYIDRGEIANLPAYSFYARIAAVYSQEPMSGVTLLVEDYGSEEIAQRVVESSRSLFAKKAEVKADKRTSEISENKPATPVAIRRHSTSQPIDEVETSSPSNDRVAFT